jgi:Holliday junction resolvasome RuvABC endonuclease subunit
MPSNSVQIICLDLALANTGVAVFSLEDADELLEIDVIHTEVGSKKVRVADQDWRRCSELCDRIKAAVNKWDPVHVFIECPTGGSKSAKAAKSMALARGVACGVLTCLNVPCTLVTPFEAKRASTGDPNASKTQVKNAVVAEFPNFTGWIKGRGGKVVKGLNEHAYDAVSVYMAAKSTKQYKDLKQ